VVIGAGPGGYEVAIEPGKAGVKTLLVERSKKRIGETCLNEGCIPAKNYLERAAYASKVSCFKSCGVKVEVEGLDLPRIQERTVALKDEILSGVLWMLEQSKVEMLYGSGCF